MDGEIGTGAGQLIEATAGLGAEDAARLIENTAAEASGDSDLDRAVVDILVGTRLGDEILQELSLEFLADLFRRSVGRLSAAEEERDHAWALLDIARRSSLTRRVAADGQTDRWASLILRLVEDSQFTTFRLLSQRLDSHGQRALFLMPGERGNEAISWLQAAGRVDLIARGLIAVTGGDNDFRVAVLSENRLEMALLDLACLTTGIVNVMIPGNATDADVAYILEHSQVRAVVVSSREQLEKVHRAREKTARLEAIFAFDADAAGGDAAPFDELLGRASETSAQSLAERRRHTTIDDLATIMYTSGTTGTPKGICFSQRNIVFKRFARALALPEIGDGDRFLCYLPLFHTFGRFFELWGCVFWGATYCFAASPAVDSLIGQMNDLEPTVFISIPMKWMQLFESIRQKVDVESASDDEIAAAVAEVTGGRLRWGLSAAGYLDPEIFRFFQRNGVELMSGFGMTEATGGITMTPPGGYREDSLGCALPGIETALAADGELKVRGPYVMIGYLDPPDGEPSFDDDGWFHTGDLMEVDERGYYRIIDRKKEIYKNVKGQTIAPQKIENLFRDFDSVGRIFLVGDHRPYNTALIYANPDVEEVNLQGLSADELKAHFRSLVVSANSFLAPYERIVDFAVIERDFSADRDELTPKGTYKRKNIERNFSDQIRRLYRRTTFMLQDVEVTVPNWLFQAIGITAQELEVDGDRLTLTTLGSELRVRRCGDLEVEVGAVRYHCERPPLDLGQLLATPRLWLGNQELFAFAPLQSVHRDRRRGRTAQVAWVARQRPSTPEDTDRRATEEALIAPSLDLVDLHRAALLLESPPPENGAIGIRLLERAVTGDAAELSGPALAVLRRASTSPSEAVRRRAFCVLAANETPALYRSTVASFMDRAVDVLDAEGTAELAERELEPRQIDTFFAETESRCTDRGSSVDARESAVALLHFLASYGTLHPAAYRRLRGFITRMAIVTHHEGIREAARGARRRLEEGFRAWLGSPSRVAVDPETGREYRWDDVVAFSEEVDDDARSRMLEAIRSTNMLREGVFVFSGGSVVRLEDILPHGIWIRLLGTEHGKSVFRVAVKTRQQDQYDLAVNLNRRLTSRQIQEEIDWLIVCSEDREAGPLVEEFGGYWPSSGLWTEEFIPGDTLDRELARLARRPQDIDRFTGIWPFAAWSALAAYIDFWDRTGRRLVIADPAPGNVIVPMHDYHSGARLVSISSRKDFESTAQLLRSLETSLLEPVEASYPQLRGLVGWDVIYSAVLEVVGDSEGIALLEAVRDSRDQPPDDEMVTTLASFIDKVGRRGFLPKRVFFAAERYRRWQELNPEATHFARATTIGELFDTYRLGELQKAHPEVRPLFFRETVFRDARQDLEAGLEGIMCSLRGGELTPQQLSDAVADLRARLTLDAEDDYFLARLSYPYLRPEDDASYVASESGGVQQSEMVVTVEDRDGQPLSIRHALSPKEVAKLHRLFLTAKLPVQFRPEHRFLVATNDRGHLAGGLFYEIRPEADAVHMEKVVVAEAFQGRGIGGMLIEELSNRLRTAGFKSLTTGFFRPEYFYRYGFTVERRYAGLVRSLSAGGHPDGDSTRTGS